MNNGNGFVSALVGIAALVVIGAGLLYINSHMSYGCINVPFMKTTCGVVTH